MQLLSFVIIEKNNNYLFVCEPSLKWRNQWFFPGGKLEKNEDPVTAAIRETKEAAACDVILDGIFYFRFFKGIINNQLHIYYHGRTDQPVEKTISDKHSLSSKWFSYEELSKVPLRQDALQVIDAYRSLQGSLPIYNFNFVTSKAPRKILSKNFNPF